jgi:hypothetical protein
MSRRVIVVRTLVTALASVLVCGIVVAELPELLSLTDNTSNDFTIRKPNSSVSPVLQSAKNVRKATTDLNDSSHGSFVLHQGTFEKAELVPTFLLYLHSILRT